MKTKQIIMMTIVAAGVFVLFGSEQMMAQQEPPKQKASSRKVVKARDSTAFDINLPSGILDDARKGDPAGALPVVVAQQPILRTSVDTSIQLDPNTLSLYTQMAAILDGYTFLPDNRVIYYSAFVPANGFEITSWSGVIENVEPNDSGYVVTVSVTPWLSSSMPIGPNYFEQYQVSGIMINYLGSLDPDGTAGWAFNLISF